MYMDIHQTDFSHRSQRIFSFKAKPRQCSPLSLIKVFLNLQWSHECTFKQIQPPSMNLLPWGSCWKKPVLLDKILPFFKNAALLPQHVEIQCEKGIKPFNTQKKKWRSNSDSIGKACHISTLRGMLTYTAQWNTVESSRGGQRVDKGEKEMGVKGGGGSKTYSVTRKEEDRQSGKVVDSKRDGSMLTCNHLRGFFFTIMIWHCLFPLFPVGDLKQP